jgi:hypothetical protein
MVVVATSLIEFNDKPVIAHVVVKLRHSVGIAPLGLLHGDPDGIVGRPSGTGRGDSCPGGGDDVQPLRIPGTDR